MNLIYVRFGDLPKDGKSFNFLTEQYEKGVSVYEAMEYEDGSIHILMPTHTGSACVSLSGCVCRPAYQVMGDKIAVGSDNEPLLANCEIIKEVTGKIHGLRCSQHG